MTDVLSTRKSFGSEVSFGAEARIVWLTPDMIEEWGKTVEEVFLYQENELPAKTNPGV